MGQKSSWYLFRTPKSIQDHPAQQEGKIRIERAAKSKNSSSSSDHGHDFIAKINWSKLYEYLQVLALPEDQYSPEKLPKLNQQEASIMVSLYHRRDQQVFNFLKGQYHASANNLSADLTQRAHYLNKGYMAYKYEGIFKTDASKPERSEQSPDKDKGLDLGLDLTTVVQQATNAKQQGPNTRLKDPAISKKTLKPMPKYDKDGNEFGTGSYYVHDTLRQGNDAGQFATPQKSLAEHHWWPSNIFAMNVWVWQGDIERFLGDDHGMDVSGGV